MVPSKRTSPGVVTKDLTNYNGRHRELEMDLGVGLIPHGDRSRVVSESVVVEERESLGKYDKYL